MTAVKGEQEQKKRVWKEERCIVEDETKRTNVRGSGQNLHEVRDTLNTNH